MIAVCHGDDGSAAVPGQPEPLPEAIVAGQFLGLPGLAIIADDRAVPLGTAVAREVDPAAVVAPRQQRRARGKRGGVGERGEHLPRSARDVHEPHAFAVLDDDGVTGGAPPLRGEALLCPTGPRLGGGVVGRRRRDGADRAGQLPPHRIRNGADPDLAILAVHEARAILAPPQGDVLERRKDDARFAAGERPGHQLLLRAEDHVVVGLLRDVLGPRHGGVVARELRVVGHDLRHEHLLAVRDRIPRDERADVAAATELVPREEGLVLWRPHDRDRPLDDLGEPRLRLLFPVERAHMEQETTAVVAPVERAVLGNVLARGQLRRAELAGGPIPERDDKRIVVEQEQGEARAVRRPDGAANRSLLRPQGALLAGARIDHEHARRNRADVRRVAVARVVGAELVTPRAHGDHEPASVCAQVRDVGGADVEQVARREGVGLLRPERRGGEGERGEERQGGEAHGGRPETRDRRPEGDRKLGQSYGGIRLRDTDGRPR